MSNDQDFYDLPGLIDNDDDPAPRGSEFRSELRSALSRASEIESDAGSLESTLKRLYEKIDR